MFEKLKLKNFQAHSKRTVEFDEKVTTIVGSSDSGKSAIIRALQWVCCNQPQGSAFIREGEKEAVVRLEVDGQVIIRRRTASVNEYRLGESKLKSFGASVPDKVADLLNLNQINTQAQHDSPFWFSETSGAVSRRLNEVVDLQIIDSSLQSSKSRVKRERTAEELAEERLVAVRKEAEELKWVEDADSLLVAVESKQKEAADVASRSADLGILVESIRKARRKVKQGQGAVEGLLGLINCAKQHFQYQQRIDSLKISIRRSKDSGALISRLSGQVELVDRVVVAGRLCLRRKDQLQVVASYLSAVRSSNQAALVAAAADRVLDAARQAGKSRKRCNQLMLLCGQVGGAQKAASRQVPDLKGLHDLKKSVEDIRFECTSLERQVQRIQEAQSSLELVSKKFAQARKEAAALKGFCPLCGKEFGGGG